MHRRKRRTVFTTPILTPCLRALGRLWLKLGRWRLVVHEPLPQPPFVMIGAPHTSNWDFPLLIAAMLELGLDISWMGKHTLFPRPIAGLMRWMGGIAIDRRQSNNMVAGTVQAFQENPGMIVFIPPEGTRKKVERWKTGFYHIARLAEVPVVMAGIDAGSRELKVIGSFRPSGDIDQDLPRIQAHYKDMLGLIPENTMPL